MPTDRNRILVESIKRLLRRGAISHLEKIVNKTHAADLSVVFRSLTFDQQHKLFSLIRDTEQKGILFSELDEDTFQDLVESIDDAELVAVFESMPNDDVADLISRLPEDRSSVILDSMRKDESREVEGLLQYEDDTAGGIMVPDFVSLREDITASEANK